jgi:hypothetical protein
MAPGGAEGQVQYRSAGAFAGAVDVEIEGGQLRLDAVATLTPPAAGGVKLFGREVGGRIYPAMVGPSGLDTALQPLLARNKIGWAQPTGNATTLSVMGLTLTAVGTATAATVAITNLHQSMRRLDYLVTVAASTAVAGFRINALQFWRGNAPGLGGFTFICRFGPATGTIPSQRMFCGLRGVTAAPTDVDPSTLTNILGMGCDAADTQLSILHNDGSGAATKVGLGAMFPKPTVDRTDVYELVLFCPPNGSQVNWEVTNLATGARAAGAITTDLPAATALLAPQAYRSVGGVSSVVGLALMSLYIETDY